MARKTLNFGIWCNDCKVECEPTETGTLCPKYGAYISDKTLEDLADY